MIDLNYNNHNFELQNTDHYYKCKKCDIIIWYNCNSKMIDLNYKNHSFELQDSCAGYHYTCTKCDIKIWYSDVSGYNFYGYDIYDLKFKHLKCEEMIIKGIIE
jgi:hypothetical protein